MSKLCFVFTVPLGPEFTSRLNLTLSSLRQQTNAPNVDVKVAVCDVSNSEECKALAEEYSDIIHYRRHGPDVGQSDAINEGWNAIPDGDVYSWLNADDYLLPNALEKVAKIFENNPESETVYGQSLIIDENNALTGIHPEVSDRIDDIERTNLISQPSCFYRKSALDEVGYLNVDHHFVMDWDLWLRFYRAGKVFTYTPDIFSCVLWEKGTKTSSWNNARMSELRALVASSGKPFTTMKTLIGFTLHHLSEYSVLAPIVKRLIGFGVNKNVNPVRFWRAVGDQREEAFIPLPELCEGALKQIVLTFDQNVSGVCKVGTEDFSFNCLRKVVLNIEEKSNENWSELALSESCFPKLALIQLLNAADMVKINGNNYQKMVSKLPSQKKAKYVELNGF